MDILAIYQFCTFGGVERVLLNRAMAFQSQNRDVNISVGYLYDTGALSSFKHFIQFKQLDRYITPYVLPKNFSFARKRYDIVQIFDTPQVFDRLEGLDNVFVECHTPYIENRKYLNQLPPKIRGILVPSAAFRSLLEQEFPQLRNIFILANPVPEDFYGPAVSAEIFAKRPLAYLARMDPLKNFPEAAQIFSSVQNREDIFQIVIGQGAKLNEQLPFLQDRHILQNTVLREKIGFEKVPQFTDMVKKHRGVFLSPSTGESFGLSAAEFICRGVPVLLSDIAPHRDLVQNDRRFLYPLGDIPGAREKISVLLDNWDGMSRDITPYGEKFSSAAFLRNWDSLIHQFDIQRNRQFSTQ
jgi:glycosyltransferase involved in cell wall biosynthesis